MYARMTVYVCKFSETCSGDRRGGLQQNISRSKVMTWVYSEEIELAGLIWNGRMYA